MNLSSILADRELMDEVRSRIERGASDPMFPIFDRRSATRSLDEIHEGKKFAIGYDIEAIVRTTGRPALFVKNGTFSVPDSEVWKNRLETGRSTIESAISAVGRIELKNHSDFEWVGTGWVVKDNIVVTNRHVAQEFALKGTSGSFQFRRNYENKEIGARIDLREEYMQPEESEFKVVKILHIEDEEGPDIAFLEVEFIGLNAPAPIKLAESTYAGAYVAAIGFPAWDGKRNDPAVMRQVFNDIYDVKRLQPGQIVKVAENYITHDCSTLGGNSGSPVIDLSTGEAVGLHFAGSYLKENSAVPAAIVKNRLRKLCISARHAA
ncbi:MAG: trypsin-like peptidase domain-containing protein [Dechloromonas sp.]|nr:MAG: trypsin-like peptidase domain-containing protein [Dechloromonas sp.]